MKLTDKSLLEQMSIHEADIEQHKLLLDFGDADIQAIKSCKGFIGSEIDTLIDNFYARLTSFDELVSIIGDSDTLLRLKMSMRRYVLELFDGFYDLDYVNSRLRIGLVHKRIGVSPKHYLSAVKFLKDVLFLAIEKEFSTKGAAPILSALEKLLYFDSELVISTYIRSLVNEIDMERDKARQYATSLEEKVAERTQELAEVSQKDELSGLFNFRALHSMLRREIARSKRIGTPLTIAYFDIDKFKKINDTKGHKKGDEVLLGLAESITKCIREDDMGCRYGGDEFCIIFSNADIAGAEVVCKRLFSDFSKKFKNITLSVGIATADLDKLDVPDTLIKEADALMYESKKKTGFAITTSF